MERQIIREAKAAKKEGSINDFGKLGKADGFIAIEIQMSKGEKFKLKTQWELDKLRGLPEREFY